MRCGAPRIGALACAHGETKAPGDVAPLVCNSPSRSIKQVRIPHPIELSLWEQVGTTILVHVWAEDRTGEGTCPTHTARCGSGRTRVRPPAVLSSAPVTRPWAALEAAGLVSSFLQVKGLRASLHHPHLCVPRRQLLAWTSRGYPGFEFKVRLSAHRQVTDFVHSLVYSFKKHFLGASRVPGMNLGMGIP